MENKGIVNILNERFGIEPPTIHDQDWEFTCGNHEQIEEYISLYHEFIDIFESEDKYVLINMILEAYWDKIRIYENKNPDYLSELWEKIEKILVEEKDIHKNTIIYWACLETSLKNAFPVAGEMRKLIYEYGWEWNEINFDDDIDKVDRDIEYLNDIYDGFEDSMIVSMNYVSGDSVDENLYGTMNQDNDLRVVFQRLDESPFSLELWFTHTRQVRFIFSNPSDNRASDILEAKLCRNDKSIFWTTWKDFDPYNKEHATYEDVILIEAEGMKWRFLND
ncbi:hypothetical protein [uncultured Eubacterium sp.]|uniref:hypothetical protein n=1 Tax=uncultured Eubacterium sp. TaxID=165185 RepID=UPI000E9D80AA|nr:hypothetical protein [uncultured Eubacterium sp.]HAV90533.1 hypothetical protein [Eubacterium sp.]